MCMFCVDFPVFRMCDDFPQIFELCFFVMVSMFFVDELFVVLCNCGYCFLFVVCMFMQLYNLSGTCMSNFLFTHPASVTGLHAHCVYMLLATSGLFCVLLFVQSNSQSVSLVHETLEVSFLP